MERKRRGRGGCVMDEGMKRKSSFSTTPLSFEAPSPANPRAYLHKPYTTRNYVPWATFLSLTVYG